MPLPYSTIYLGIASRDKNVSTCAIIRAKPGTEPGVHKLLANYQTGRYSLKVQAYDRLERKSRIAYKPFVYDLTRKLSPLKRDDQSPRQ